MKNKFELNILKLLTFTGILSFFNLIRKPPMKDWIMIFLIKSYIATFLDNLAVRNGYIRYPVKLLKSFDISVIFSYLIFPITCIYFNQLTKQSKIVGTLITCIAFSVPMALFENILEKNTKLIKYKRNWSWIHSLCSIFFTFIIVRSLYKLINSNAEKQSNENQETI